MLRYVLNKLLMALLAMTVLYSCTQDSPAAPLFEYLPSDASNIRFENTIENTAALNILNYIYFYNGAGVALADFNNDGLIDIYFTANTSADRMYLNQGALKFLEITQESNIHNDSGFTTGVSVVDINADGLLDIYISKVALDPNANDHNLLYVNQGNSEAGTPQFEEMSPEYNLDIAAYATQSYFFDYDLDGDLDLYLLNHSTQPNRSYGKGIKRTLIDSLHGDRLYENKEGLFTEVSRDKKIYQGPIGYGLGASIGDVNGDHYPDIYVGNDFFENDYLYLNRQTHFEEVHAKDSKKLGHTSHFSMGNIISDLNNDAYPDILSLDMLPEDLKTRKVSAQEYNFQIYANYLKNGYAPQYMQNTLHLNRGNESFSEVAFLSGIAATEWSWTPIAADFDNDGFKDLYITNGILGATNDMDFINFISNETIQENLSKGTDEVDLALIEKIPQKITPNYFYKNKGGMAFQDMSSTWIDPKNSLSNGAAAADLDNDGDMDIVVNNVNQKAFILKNNSNEQLENNHFIKIAFQGSANNPFGVGAQIKVYQNDGVQQQENYNAKGYLSAVQPALHFGLGNLNVIDSLHVIWPDKKEQRLYNITGDQTLILKYDQASAVAAGDHTNDDNTVLPVLNFRHQENPTLDFNRDLLIPYSNASLGPAMAINDLDNDGLDDIFLGGAKGQPSVLLMQTITGEFKRAQDSLFQKTALHEDVSAVFADVDNDGFDDLIVGSGGNEFASGRPIQPRLYRNTNGVLREDEEQFKNISLNSAKIKAVDIDQDGDTDLCFLSNTTPNGFGQTPRQYIMINDGSGDFIDGTASIAPQFQELGNLTDIVFDDFNNDGTLDFIVCGYWLPITLFTNTNGVFEIQQTPSFKNTNGWYNSIVAHDFDNDGDLDCMLGNWGLNSRLSASASAPITLYSGDFDDNGRKEPLLTYFYHGIETSFSSKEELVKQMPFINKDYLTHQAFAAATIDQIFSREKLNKADQKKVFNLNSIYLENTGDFNFNLKPLPEMAQISMVSNIHVDDFNKDGYADALLTGNHYEISTQLSRLDASHGEVFLNDKKGGFVFFEKQNFDISGVVRDTDTISIQGKKYVLVARNNDSPQLISVQVRN